MFEKKLGFKMSRAQLKGIKHFPDLPYEEKDAAGRTTYKEWAPDDWTLTEYNDRGNVTYKELSNGEWERTTFNKFNKVIRHQNHEGVDTKVYYDRRRRPVRSTFADGGTIWVKYDKDELGDYSCSYNEKDEWKVTRFNPVGEALLTIYNNGNVDMHKDLNDLTQPMKQAFCKAFIHDIKIPAIK